MPKKEVRKLFAEVRSRMVFRNNRAKWTYIIYDRSSGLSKIGISADPLRRQRECRCFRPNSFLFLLHTANLEHELHNRFKDRQMEGEWFLLKEEDFNDLICNDGFRYMYGLVDDDVEKSKLYVVQQNELKQAKQSCKHYEKYECCQQIYDLYLKHSFKTVAVKKANELGIRTPSGFPWKVPFASKVISHIEEIKKSNG